MKIEKMEQNENHRVYHFRRSVSRPAEHYKWDRDSGFNEANINPEWIRLAEQFPQIVGISSFHAYELGLTKGHAFEWEEFSLELESYLGQLYPETIPVSDRATS